MLRGWHDYKLPDADSTETILSSVKHDAYNKVALGLRSRRGSAVLVAEDRPDGGGVIKPKARKACNSWIRHMPYFLF